MTWVHDSDLSQFRVTISVTLTWLKSLRQMTWADVRLGLDYHDSDQVTRDSTQVTWDLRLRLDTGDSTTTLSLTMHFITNVFRPLFIDQLVRSKATCPFKMMTLPFHDLDIFQLEAMLLWELSKATFWFNENYLLCKRTQTKVKHFIPHHSFHPNHQNNTPSLDPIL